jgi:hypothetical protein
VLPALFCSDALASAARNGTLEGLLCLGGIVAETMLDIGDEIRTPMSMHVVRQLFPFREPRAQIVNY